MSKLIWDKTGERYYETGVSQGVLYPQESGVYPKGVAWNGLTAVTESPSGAEPTPLYADNIKYLNLRSAEEFAATVEAYTYPDEFAVCDGSATIADGITIGQQPRKPFGMSWKTVFGNDTENDDYGYKLHLVYGATAAPSEKAYATVNDSPEAITFSWELSTTPVNVTGFKPTANLTVDSTKVPADKLKQLEDILYGVEAPAFSQSKTYNVGDYVTYESKTYKCITKVTSAGAWSASSWKEEEAPGPRLPLPDEVVELVGLTSK